jgi:tetratricopeptide (TPR) repeat protein
MTKGSLITGSVALLFGLALGALWAQHMLDNADKARAEAYSFAALEQYKADDLTEALMAAHEAAALNPESYYPYLLLGRIYLKRGDVGLARAMLERAGALIDQTVTKTPSMLSDRERLRRLIEGLPKREASAGKADALADDVGNR